jgi:hypothetical protein
MAASRWTVARPFPGCSSAPADRDVAARHAALNRARADSATLRDIGSSIRASRRRRLHGGVTVVSHGGGSSRSAAPLDLTYGRGGHQAVTAFSAADSGIALREAICVRAICRSIGTPVPRHAPFMTVSADRPS